MLERDLSQLIIFSGGQTGADRAALDFAIKNHIRHGGWCPRGRRAEDGPLDTRYKLQETPSESYEERTEWNVRDSDGTVIFTFSENISGGTFFTSQYARRIQKPLLHLSRQNLLHPVDELVTFISINKIKKLNIAGPRASKEPKVYDFVLEVLKDLFSRHSHIL